MEEEEGRREEGGGGQGEGGREEGGRVGDRRPFVFSRNAFFQQERKTKQLIGQSHIYMCVPACVWNLDWQKPLDPGARAQSLAQSA